MLLVHDGWPRPVAVRRRLHRARPRRLPGRALCLAAIVTLHGVVLWAALRHTEEPPADPPAPAVTLVLIEQPAQRTAPAMEKFSPSIHIPVVPPVAPITLPAPSGEPAVSAVPPPPPSPLPAVGGTEAAEDPGVLVAWRARLYQQLAHFRRYPGIARARGQQGVVLVHFVMDRAGHVLSAAVQGSCGFPVLDAEALELLRRAEPLPAAPPQLRGQQLEVTLPVQFSLAFQ